MKNESDGTRMVGLAVLLAMGIGACIIALIAFAPKLLIALCGLVAIGVAVSIFVSRRV